MLAAARAEKGKGGAAPAPAAPKADKPVADSPKVAPASPQSAPAKARTETAPPAAESAKPDRGKMSVAEMLAYARAEKNLAAEPSAAAAPPAAKPKSPAAAPAAKEIAQVEEPVEEQVAEEEVAESSAPTATAAGGKLSKREECKTVAQQLAYCRKVDGAR
jgi:translation initiation factor IF-2